MKPCFKEIARNFTFEGEFIEANPYGCGHINDTYAVYFRKADGETHRYILQRINHRVFKNPEKLMENIEGVTQHLRKKIATAKGDCERETLNIIPTLNQKSFYRTEDGDYWRSYIFIENAKTYEKVENLSHFYNAGKAFGKFQNLLADFPADKLYETIPNFHHTRKRFDAFIEAVDKDIMNRAKGVCKEIEFAQKREKDTSVILDLLQQDKIPLRVTHNDTKFNNIMIDDKTGEGMCVIDLDTVMSGSALYDFGDSVRFGASSASEDEEDISKVWMEIELYEQFTKGFIGALGQSLTCVEAEYLPFAAKIMTFECGLRFLTDYINGDTYFKVHKKEHNLLRTRTQFKLVEDMETKLDEMYKIAQKYR